MFNKYVKKRYLIFLITSIIVLIKGPNLVANNIDSLLNQLEQSVFLCDFEEAFISMDSIDKIPIENGSRQHLRSLWLNSSYFYQNRVLDKSFEDVRQLKILSTVAKDSVFLARAYYRIGTLYYIIGDFTRYLENIKKAKNIASSAGDAVIYARCRMGEIIIESKTSEDFHQLNANYLEVYEDIKDLESDEAYDAQLAILFNLEMQYRKYDKDNAQILTQILALSKKARRTDTEAGVLFLRNYAHLKKGDIVQAIATIKEAYEVAEKANDYHHLVEACGQLATIYEDLKQYKKAFEYKSKLYIFNQANEERFQKSANAALRKYLDFENVSSENVRLTELNELTEAKMNNLKMVNGGIAMFVCLGFVTGYFFFLQSQEKNKTEVILAKQEAQLWSERFNSAEKDKKLAVLTSFQEGQGIIRDRIAMVLHDKIAGGIAGIKLILSNENIMDKNSGKPILNQLDELYNYSRNLSHFYYDPIPEDVPFSEIIRNKVKQSAENTGVEITCSIYPRNKINKLNSLVKIEVYRYISELLRNMEVHSQASKGEITLTYRENGLYIMVSDNGVGKSIQAENQDGIGLQIIVKRLALLNGEIEINAEAQKGYSCTIFIPESAILNMPKNNVHA